MALFGEWAVATSVCVGDRLPHVFERFFCRIGPVEMNRFKSVLRRGARGWGMGYHKSFCIWGERSGITPPADEANLPKVRDSNHRLVKRIPRRPSIRVLMTADNLQ